MNNQIKPNIEPTGSWVFPQKQPATQTYCQQSRKCLRLALT